MPFIEPVLVEESENTLNIQYYDHIKKLATLNKRVANESTVV